MYISNNKVFIESEDPMLNGNVEIENVVSHEFMPNNTFYCQTEERSHWFLLKPGQVVTVEFGYKK